MASDDELDPTQTQSQTNGEPNLYLNDETELRDIWGQLIAKNKPMLNYGENQAIECQKIIYQLLIYFADLVNDTFSAGRANNCDYCFSAPNVPSKLLLQTSKVHFTITKDLKDASNPIYLEVSPFDCLSTIDH